MATSGGATAGGGTKDVKHTLVGAQYNLSKRTSFYVISSDKKVDNAIANDGDHKEMGFGVRHAF